MFENKTLSFADIKSGEHYKQCYFLKADYQVKVSDCLFESCTFEQTEFAGSEWLDCRFKNIIFSNCNFFKSVFYRCEFERCQLIGASFANNLWKENRLIDSRGDYLNLSESNLHSVTFANCNLVEAYFQSVKIKGKLIFTACELSSANFNQTNLLGIDFSSSHFDTLYFSPDLIRGALINPYQGQAFLSLLGVKIKD